MQSYGPKLENFLQCYTLFIRTSKLGPETSTVLNFWGLFRLKICSPSVLNFAFLRKAISSKHIDFLMFIHKSEGNGRN